ncbi:MAG TPA: hypothetical protein VFO44_08485, partial [Steroidobacteraceae bacterium]|nr:hypothetical protein [Steroidobacteraceae bacterium]
MSNTLRSFLLCLAIAELSGCGGGSGPGAPPPTQTNPSQPTAQDLANAKAADLTGILDLSANTMTLSWVDNFKSATGYNIEQRSSSGNWNVVETIPGQGGTGQRVSWMRTVTAQSAFRVTAQLSGYTVTLLTTEQQDSVLISPPATAPSIVLDQPEPVTDSVAVSLQNAGKLTGVEYFVDSTEFGTSSASPDFPAILDTAQIASTSHMLRARMQTGPGAFLEVHRSVTVAQANLGLTVVVKGTTGTVRILVVATSNVGVQSASASLDGVSLGTLTQTNAVGTLGPAFEFTVDALKAGSGPHVIMVTAVDVTGASASTSVLATFNNAPTLALGSPVDGALVNGTLTLSGTFGSDKPGPVNLVVSLGNSTILQTSTSPFNATIDLGTVAGLPHPGNATLTLVATDSTGTSTRLTSGVTITSSPTLVFTPLVSIGPRGTLLTVSQSAALYQTEDQFVHLHFGSTDTVLDTTTLFATANWLMSGTDVVAIGALNDGKHLFHWGTDGVRHDLGVFGGSGDAMLQLQGLILPWVLVVDNPVATFVNLTTGSTIVPTLATPDFGPQQAEVNGFPAILPATPPFYVSANGLVLFYVSNSAGTVNIERWDQSTGQSQVVGSNGANLETDGSRLIWLSSPSVADTTPPLTSLDIGSGTVTTVSTSEMQFQLADGLVAWTERLLNVENVALKASDGATITTLPGAQTLYGTAGGRVLYELNDTLDAWSAQHGAQLLLDVPPGKAMIAGGAAYFTNGSQ